MYELPTSQVFKVVAVSSNMNSFGLTGMILMRQDGVAYQVGANSIRVKKVGETVTVPCDWNEVDPMGDPMINYHFYSLGFEIPERMPDVPFDVAQKVWN